VDKRSVHHGDRIRRDTSCIRRPGLLSSTAALLPHGSPDATSQAVTRIFRMRFPRTLGPLGRAHLPIRLFTLGAIGTMHTPSPRYIDVDQWTGAHDASMRRGRREQQRGSGRWRRSGYGIDDVAFG
jgi:hypothetical protein